jgi:Rifampin ADP-ribosyl transferase
MSTSAANAAYPLPGNPTKSYRSREPLRVIGEVTEWQGHSPEQLKVMKDHIEELKRLGGH